MTTIETDTFDLFAGLSRKHRSRIDGLCTPARVSAGRVLATEGSYGHECFLVLAGTVAIERSGTEIAQAGPGDLVGEIAMLDGPYSRRTATARVTSDAELLTFSTTDFRRLMTEHPTVAARVNRTAVHRLHDDLEARS